MSNSAPLSSPPEISSDALADPRVEQTLALVKTLIGTLPPQAKEHFLRQVAESLRPAAAPRAGEVLGTILRFISKRKGLFTIAELKQQVGGQGLTASPKEIYNAIGYLTRKRHIRRVSYGSYRNSAIEGTREKLIKAVHEWQAAKERTDGHANRPRQSQGG